MGALALLAKHQVVCQLSSPGSCAPTQTDSHTSSRSLRTFPARQTSRRISRGQDLKRLPIAERKRGRSCVADSGRHASCVFKEGQHDASIYGSKACLRRNRRVSPPRRKQDDTVEHAAPHVPAAAAFPSSWSAEDIILLDNRTADAPTQGPKNISTDSQETSLLNFLQRLISPATSSILLLNLLAALYGTNTLASKMIDASAADIPASLTTLARYGITTLAFLPALKGAALLKQPGLLLAGCELGLQTFLGYLCGAAAAPATTESNASLLFMFTVLAMPLMEIFAGRSVSKLTWGSTLAALTAMALLAWEGANVHDVLAPHLNDIWPFLSCALSAAHIFRSESLSSSFDPLHLTALQLGVTTLLSLGWEGWSLMTSSTHVGALSGQLESLPWGPLLYSGLVCAGFCQWAELKGLRHVPASTATLIYTTIPLWGALLSFLISGELPGGATTLGATLLICAALGRVGLRGVGNLEVAEVSASNWLGKHASSQEGLPAALLSTQLKLPFYAAEAQRILTETKLQLQAAKSTVDSWFSTITSGDFLEACSSRNACDETRILSEATGTALHPSSASDIHTEAVQALEALAKKLSHVTETLEADLALQLPFGAREGFQTGDSLAQLWTSAAEPPSGWMAHVLTSDGSILSHLLHL